MRAKFLIKFQEFDGSIHYREINIQYDEHDETYSATDLGDNLNSPESAKILGCGKDHKYIPGAIKSLLGGRVLLSHGALE
jgi:hypothetical protein